MIQLFAWSTGILPINTTFILHYEIPEKTGIPLWLSELSKILFLVWEKYSWNNFINIPFSTLLSNSMCSPIIFSATYFSFPQHPFTYSYSAHYEIHIFPIQMYTCIHTYVCIICMYFLCIGVNTNVLLIFLGAQTNLHNVLHTFVSSQF